ncbi:hypothetical protein LWI28_023005 [Acer negundo]|uniref:PGG domain-containing protein n=1 Tax=Acer negundo TaxID=4023 RepID=A0AAD5P5S9_ACENE|nr:hypothetical protein LWI28_023005 [Acer negundo]KAK4857784.1 hypothetical protein QYF36_006265 [Acer negundo]
MDQSRINKLYQSVSKQNWEDMMGLISSKDKDVMLLLHPISVHKDNIVHLAVHSKKKKPLNQILEFVDKNMRHSFTSSVNAYGNTVMHEAAICRNLEAVQLLVAENKELLRLENDSGETPLFRAAAYGNTEIVKFLAYHENEIVTNFEKKKQLKDHHRKRNDDTSILRVAVKGKHFGTALELLKLDPELAKLEDKDGSTDLYYLLHKMSSSLKSGYRMNIWEKILYFCLPIGCGNNDEADNIQTRRLPQWTTFQTRRLEVSHLIYLSIWRFIIAGCPVVKRIWKEKRGYKLASKLADELVNKDKSILDEEEEKEKEKERRNIPLFAAIKKGNTKIFKSILKKYPQALELVDHRKQNILHVAATYRQKEIFNFVKGKEIQKNRLARQIDINGYTILHCVADMEYYEGGTGPPYHLLREELEWFDSVEEITPTYYTMLETNNKMTAWDFFKITHENQRQEAQKCIKNTCQLCIAVAILVFFFVLAAAAFTVPGGGGSGTINSDYGSTLPILLLLLGSRNPPFFLFFTVPDIIALSCSLTAAVMFLSLSHTLPLKWRYFLVRIPRQLRLGFALLFVSVATTMLAFASTVYLIIIHHHDSEELQRRWRMNLVCSTAFLPLSLFSLTYFPLFRSFIQVLKNIFDLLLRFLRFLGKLISPNFRKTRE